MALTQAVSEKGALWEIAAFARAAHSFLDTYGTATRDVIVKFLAAPRRCPSRQPAGASS
jgi:hypothetical protein